MNALLTAARRFWQVPDEATLVAAPGASALIAALPGVLPHLPVHIPEPTYNEHRAAFAAHGATFRANDAPVQIRVHPNNPDGKLTRKRPEAEIVIIDESFCDTCPAHSLVAHTARPGTILLKSFGKFWGLAGLRLGFAIGHPKTLGGLSERIGPWAVSGPALGIGAAALNDFEWAERTRERLREDAGRLDALLQISGANCVGGTSLFRLYDIQDAACWHNRLSENRILSRIFPYSDRWLRLGLPAPDSFDRLATALAAL